MASDARWVALLALVMLAACGGGGEAQDQAQADEAAFRARMDSVRQVRRAKDSLALVARTACVDSAKAALGQTARGRRALQAAGDGEAAEVTAVCGPVPASFAEAAPAAPAGATAGAGATPTEAVATTAPAGEPEPTMAPTSAPVPKAPAQAAADRRARETDLRREAFAYSGGDRDPFQSLMQTESTGPELVDLRLVAVLLDLRASSNSVAVLRDRKSGKQYRVRTGERVGRARVTQIRNRDVVFAVEDFGTMRQETLTLKKAEDATQ